MALKLSDLQPAPRNPRTITDAALSGLTASLSEFGDLSGIVWNQTSGHLVCGHQRFKALQAEHGDGLTVKANKIVTPAGGAAPTPALTTKARGT